MIGLDNVTGLQAARILAGRGVPVIAVASDPRHFACRTRVCKQIVYSDTESDALLTTLEELGPTLRDKAVLFPCTDLSVLSISRSRDRLNSWYSVALPSPDVVEMFMHKRTFFAFAKASGLPIPLTVFIQSRDDALEAAASLTFPCVVKPSFKTDTWMQNATAKAYKLDNGPELLEFYDRASKWSDDLLAQDWVRGPAANHYTCNCYFNEESKPLVTFVTRKLRQWPPETGTGSLGQEFRNDLVLNETVRLFESVQFRGLAYLEMKRDERTGQHFIIEPNIGRPTGRSATAEAAGVELLYTQYCDSLGLPLPTSLEQRYQGVKWVYARRDLQSAIYHWWRGELTFGDWARSWRGRKVDAVFSRTDPLPFFLDLWRAAARAARMIRAR